MCAPSPPPPPDYTGAAQAQGQANVDAARVTGQMNNPNVVGPYGTQNVTWAGDQPTLTQTLSPEQQAILDSSSQAKIGMNQLANQGVTSLQGVVGTPVDFSGIPQPGNYDATRKSVIDAMMSRANEDYAKQTDNNQSNLIAAGIRPGTKAYADQQQMIERSRNDARQQAEIAGGNAASQAYGIDANRQQVAMNQYLSQRQTPINEITALMSGSQVSNPFTTPGYNATANVQPTPILAGTQLQGQAAADIYNTQAQGAANLQSGLFGLGGSGLMGAGMYF